MQKQIKALTESRGLLVTELEGLLAKETRTADESARMAVLNTEIEKYKVYPTILACGELLHLPSSKTYNLYDLQGSLICSIPESINELRMDFPAGLYLLKNEGKTIKIVLTK